MKLSINNLCFEYGNKAILKDFSLEISSSSILSIVGSSGVGKTTLFSILGGFLKSSGGKVILDEIDITDLKPEKRPVVTMFQDGGLFPHLSIIDNIKFGLKSKFNKARFAGIDIEKYAMDLLLKVGLKGMHARFPNELSGGQKQRVSLARSIAVKPKVLLLDEPFSALDPALKYQLNLLLNKIISEEDIIAIKITHDLNDALLSSSKVMLIQDSHNYSASPLDIAEGRASINLLNYFKTAYPISENESVLAKDLHVDQRSKSVCFSIASVRSVGHLYEYLLNGKNGAINYISSEVFSETVTLYYDLESIIEVKI